MDEKKRVARPAQRPAEAAKTIKKKSASGSAAARTTAPAAKSAASAKRHPAAEAGRTVRPAGSAAKAPARPAARAAGAKRTAASAKPAASRPKATTTGAKKPVTAARKPAGSRAAARAAARRAKRQRLALIASALVCVLCLGGALGIHLLRGRDSSRAGVPNAPEAEIAALPMGEASTGIQLAHANKPTSGEPDFSDKFAGANAAPEETAAAAEAAPEAVPAGDLTEETPAVTESAEAADPTMEPAPLPEVRKIWSMGDIASGAETSNKAYKYEQKVVAAGKSVKEYARQTPVAMGEGGDYAQVEGVLTFRGNNYRDSAAYGTIPNDANGLSIAWTKNIGGIDKWTGVGWTGQASIVRWPEETRRIMNINAEKQDKDGLKEVIYGTLDGHIYFLDLDDGQATRKAIAVPSSIKGSVSVDPRGLPLLYCGQGIPEVDGKSVKIGTRVFSLIDQEVLFFLNGRDDFCLRHWYAFDCAPLVDAGSDTMLQLGENGIFYSVTLNTDFNADAGTISVDPVVDRMVYRSAISTRPGMENSLSVYDHYAYYTDNSGLLTCLDVNTLEAVWLADVGDDSDASIVIEEDEDGVWLYQACELDQNGLSGNVYCRKFNALTGEEMWKVPVDCLRASKDVDAGGFATPAVGKGELSDIVYFNICRVREGGGTLLAIDKKTGETLWTRGTGGYSWSSPVCVYDANGRGYFVLGNAKGILRLCDGLTGADIASVDLGANIEGSPAVFDDMLVIGTRGGKIFGVKITGDEI